MSNRPFTGTSSCIYASFDNRFSKYLLRTYLVSGIMLAAGNTIMYKMDLITTLMGIRDLNNRRNRINTEPSPYKVC